LVENATHNGGDIVGANLSRGIGSRPFATICRTGSDRWSGSYNATGLKLQIYAF
jgi:hypothetical protein